jgi:hypothetical protein
MPTASAINGISSRWVAQTLTVNSLFRGFRVIGREVTVPVSSVSCGFLDIACATTEDGVEMITQGFASLH